AGKCAQEPGTKGRARVRGGARFRWSRDAAHGRDAITALMAEFPGAGVGLRAGERMPDGRFLFVIDPDDAAEAARWMREAATCRRTTPGGGAHLIYGAPFPVRCGRMGASVDVKGTGGYIVLAGRPPN